MTFSPQDLEVLSDLTATTWRGAADLDRSVRAGTLEWSCTRTATGAPTGAAVS